MGCTDSTKEHAWEPMSSSGVTERVHRLQGPGGRCLLVALDHGLPAGPLPGIEDPARFLRARPEDAADLGADAVSVQVHFGSDHEDVMLASAGRVADDARALGLPVLLMAYPLGREGGPPESAVVAHAARAAAEIGGALRPGPF